MMGILYKDGKEIRATKKMILLKRGQNILIGLANY